MATLTFSWLHGPCLPHQTDDKTLVPGPLLEKKNSENTLECLYSMGAGEVGNSPYPSPPPPYSGDRWVNVEPVAGKALSQVPVCQLLGLRLDNLPCVTWATTALPCLEYL